LPTLLYFIFFSTAQNILKFCQTALGHLVLPLPTSRNRGKTKKANLATAPLTENIIENKVYFAHFKLLKIVNI
jgi:hypothetical protein